MNKIKKCLLNITAIMTTAIFVISPSPAIIHTPTNPMTSPVDKSCAITYFANGLFNSLLIESKVQGIAKHSLLNSYTPFI